MQMLCKNGSREIDVDTDDPMKEVQFFRKSPVLLQFSCLLMIMFFLWIHSTDSYSAVSLTLQEKWKERKCFPKVYKSILNYIECFRFSFRLAWQKKKPLKEINDIFSAI